MKPFPDEHELIALFESEPTLTDKGVPWVYNRLTFTLLRGVHRITCVIEPSYEVLELEWSRTGKMLVSLSLNRVSGIETELNAETEVLVAHFCDKHLLDLRIQTKPDIRVAWGTSEEPV